MDHHRIVITGALGHIGSYLMRVLPQHLANVEFVLVDNMLTQRYTSLFDLPADAKYRFVEADVTACDLDPLIAGANAVVHLAAITDATKSFENKDAVERNNHDATERVARACARLGVPMIHASSTSVYGTQAEVVDETCGEDELKPQSPYAETKLREERLVQRLARDEGLRAVTCRFGTIFGFSAGIRFHTAVNKFCWQAVAGQPLTVWQTAYDQKRPYLDLKDAARAVAFFIATDLFDGRVYNVVTANATVRQVTDAIRAHVPDLGIDFVEARIMNQLSYEVRNTLLAEKGFTPIGSMEAGIAATIRALRHSQSLA